MMRYARFIFAAAVVAAMTASPAFAAKNIILMISDGLGMNGWEASSYFLYDQTPDSKWHENLPYGTQNGFEMYGSTHYMLNPDGSEQGYDKTQMWADFNYTKGDDDYLAFTDSAAAATALYTGTKTYKGAVGVDFNGSPLTSIAQYADQYGKATGAISSVQMSHATPAAVFAHNVARGNYADIANEMIYNSPADVIMGCGEDAVDGYSKYVGGETTWNDITDADGANGFEYVADVADFQALADGTYNGGSLPGKVLGIPHTKYTLSNEYLPGDNPETVVPTLETMTKAAVNVLAQDPEGFFLMVEGGDVDWKNHANDGDSMFSVQKDFDNSVQAVIDWVDQNSSWEETQLIVTSDHETGMIWGEGSWTDVSKNNGQYDEGEPYTDLNQSGDWTPGEPYEDVGDGFYDDGEDIFHDFMNVADNGKGTMPGMVYSSGGHSNQLVPLFAKGADTERFADLVRDTDLTAGSFWGFDGQYVDNTDVFTVMQTQVPEPATIALMGLAGLALRRRG